MLVSRTRSEPAPGPFLDALPKFDWGDAFFQSEIRDVKVTLGCLMKCEPFPVRPKPNRRFTNLSVRITQEEDGYTVQVRLYSEVTPENDAWGEELADSVETASMMVEALAAEFSILPAQIKIDIWLQDRRAGTRH
jgi:hypothetical protein